MARRLASVVVLLVFLAASATTGSAAQGQEEPGEPGSFDFQGEEGGRSDADRREGTVAPPAARQRGGAGAEGEIVRWNRFGTAQTVTRAGGGLAEGLPADPEAAARQWIADRPDLFGVSSDDVADLELLRVSPIGLGHSVLLRQRFASGDADLPAGIDGQVAVAVVNGSVAHAWSSLTRDTEVTGAVDLSVVEAVVEAAADAGRPIDADDVTVDEGAGQDGWTMATVAGFDRPVQARQVAVPTPVDGVRPSWEVLLMDVAASEGVSQLVDAENGEVLVTTDLVDHAAGGATAATGGDHSNDPDNPDWEAFPSSPRLDHSGRDTRQTWCWDDERRCDRVVANPASPTPWDVDAVTGTPTLTTRGNNARSTEKWNANGDISQGTVYATPSPDRSYDYRWTNQWFDESCNPTVFTSAERNDIDAAMANLFVSHNRMHDWSYHLGFTEENFNAQASNFGRGGRENDPEHGNAQAGGVVGGPPNYASRDNANQFWTPDGVAATTNMYLWQVVPGAFYSPCVDGDYDMTVIGHEYTHLTSNRMTGGPDDRLRDHQANAMGESWSDQASMELLNELGMVPVGDENPWAVGPYVTGDGQRGIRNYGMNHSPLNYSDVGYDLTGPQVHADGEIWSATNYAIRQAMIGRHGSGTRTRQAQCAAGQRPATACPGNYRWIQLVFDAWLLMPNRASMVDARDAMLAADLLRFGGADLDLLWNTFARYGLGEGATSNGGADTAPTPDFSSPYRTEGTLSFAPTGAGGAAVTGELYVGKYEARARPIADTDPTTDLPATADLVPGSYDLLVRADGYGTKRLSVEVRAGRTTEVDPSLRPNLASSANGAVATGDGVNLDKLIDDTEATNWAATGAPVEGREVTVALDPGQSSHTVERVQVSALLRPAIAGDADPGGQNRFSALRQFEILTCRARPGVDCSDDAQFRSIYTSRPDAFPAVAPRPRAPDMIMRSFDVPRTRATHVMLRVLDNQCTGTPAYRGDQDDDPRHDTDCVTGSAAATGVAQGTVVRAAELQVFDR